MTRARPALRVAGLAVAGLVAGAGAARADFIDAIARIVGAEPSPRQVYLHHPGYLYHDEEAEPRLRRVRPDEGLQPAETPRSRPIDPIGNPAWYLQDPTLRRGDIVVLPGEVLVFQGGQVPYSRADFAPLGASRLPLTQKRQIAAMTGVRLADEAGVARRTRTAGTGAD